MTAGDVVSCRATDHLNVAFVAITERDLTIAALCIAPCYRACDSAAHENTTGARDRHGDARWASPLPRRPAAGEPPDAEADVSIRARCHCRRRPGHRSQRRAGAGAR